MNWENQKLSETMIGHKHTTGVKNYATIGQTQQGMTASRRLEFLHVIELPTPFLSENDIAVNMMVNVRMLASLPNQSYVTAIDINIIKELFMSMDPRDPSETQAILDDDDIMSALERADRQYKEGRAKSLHNLIEDLGFEVDALRD
ncbi:MAG: hypothetical protein ABR985_11760 [Methanotrichaceae archaeon]|jgi:hypothetical protein